MNPINIPMAELKPALAGLGKVINRRPTLPVLGCIRVERTKIGRIELAVIDLDTSVVVGLDTPAQGETATFLIPYEDLANVAKSCGKEETLLITPVEGSRVAIRFPVAGQMIEHTCDSIPVEEFPPIPEIRAEPVLLDGDLRQAIHDAFACASTDSTRRILNGACLDVSQPQGHCVVSTDGHHLFSSNSFTLGLKESIVIPNHRFLNWKEFNQDGDWSLRAESAERNQPPRFEIATQHWRFITSALDGRYPNWRAVVPDVGNVKTTLEIEPGALDAVNRTIARMPDHDSRHHSIGLEIAGHRVALLGKSPGSDQWTRIELVDGKVTGSEVTTHLNRQFLAKALRFGLNRIEIIDALTPLRFSSGGRQMIVMPVRPAPTAESETNNSPVESKPPVESTTTTPSQAEQPENSMAENYTNNGASRSNNPAAPAGAEERPALEAALAQIEAIKSEFRNVITGLNKLGDLLKQAGREQKANEKEFQGVRQTLRSLQNVRI